MRVTIRPRWWESADTPTLVVLIDGAGTVTREDGTPVGRVAKGHRTYSPPTHKGSQIARYHKQVLEWHGWRPDLPTYARPDVRRDTRADVLRELLRDV